MLSFQHNLLLKGEFFMLKKCSSLLLALALITVLFTGCRGNAKNENQTGDPGTSTTSATTATKTADTTVRPTNVGSRSYSKWCGGQATLPTTPDRRSRNGYKSSLARWALASCWTIKSSCA